MIATTMPTISPTLSAIAEPRNPSRQIIMPFCAEQVVAITTQSENSRIRCAVTVPRPSSSQPTPTTAPNSPNPSPVKMDTITT